MSYISRDSLKFFFQHVSIFFFKVTKKFYLLLITGYYKFSTDGVSLELYVYHRSELGKNVSFNVSYYGLLLSLLSKDSNLLPSHLYVEYTDLILVTTEKITQIPNPWVCQRHMDLSAIDSIYTFESENICLISP